MSHTPIILHIAIDAPLRQVFDYRAPDGIDQEMLVPGVRVSVPFGRASRVGWLVSQANHSDVPLKKLRSAKSILDVTPILPKPLWQLLQWMSAYYHCPMGLVCSAAFPTFLKQGKPLPAGKLEHLVQSDDVKGPILNAAQRVAVDQFVKALGAFQSFLLYGVTGSGKTEVYLNTIAAVLAEGKQVLVLVPEIGLAPQTLAQFRSRLGVPVAVLHSGLTDRERTIAWEQAAVGSARVVIGTRSALFAPLSDLGLIIVDEEHDTSFKQMEGLRYHARDCAVMRAQFSNVPIILGSATPSLESWYNAERGRYKKVELTYRAGNAQLPTLQSIDVRTQPMSHGLSPTLSQTIQQHLTEGGQVLLFLNRRGYAQSMVCHACGFSSMCDRCHAYYTVHRGEQLLVCHLCGSATALPSTCPSCAHPLSASGLGTERLEAALVKHFPNVPIVRLDRDTTRRRGALAEKLTEIRSGSARLLVGTQLLAKGHDFPNVTLVAIVNADQGIYCGEFHATERLAQTILQVAGRAGRAEKPGTVLVQTHCPDHPLLQAVLSGDYARFATHALSERKQAGLPPYGAQILLRASATQEAYPLDFLEAVRQLIFAKIGASELVLLGPVPAVRAKVAGRYHAQLLLQSPERVRLQRYMVMLLPEIQALPLFRRVRFIADVDPVDIY